MLLYVTYTRTDSRTYSTVQIYNKKRSGGYQRRSILIDWRPLAISFFSLFTEAEFLEEIQKRSLKEFSSCYSQSPLLLCLEISISSNSRNLTSCVYLQTHETSYIFIKIKLEHTVKEKGGKHDKKTYSLPYG
jgi:hypothetical protein